MPRFIGKSTNGKGSVAEQLDNNIQSEINRSSWTKLDFYSNMITNEKDGGNAYKRICLDFTDDDMSANQPLKRFHQVVICGNDQKLTTKSDKNGNLVGGFTNDRTFIITAQLPPTFRYNIGGNWSTPLKSVLDFSSFNGITSMFTSGQNSALFGLATMSVWESPNPLQIQLTLSCFDDIASSSNRNTLEAIDIFSRWSLPYMVTQYGMYAGLPGPAVPPISIKYNKYTKKESEITSNNGEKTTSVTYEKNKETGVLEIIVSKKDVNRLSVLVGGMLFLDYCILKSVDVNYVNTKAQYLHDYKNATFTNNSGITDAGIRLLPVRCDITLTFETIMGLTQTNFRNMLALRENNNPANLSTIDVSPLQNVIGNNAVSAGISNTMEYASSFGLNTQS